MDASSAEAQRVIRRINSTEDFYRILGVSKQASSAQIKREFRVIARAIHPDKCQLPGAEDAFKKLNAAHKCLSNEESRSHYDLTGSEMNEAAGHSQSPFGPGGADLFAEMFRHHGRAGAGAAEGAHFRSINLNDLIPTRLSWLLRIPGVVPLLALGGAVLAFKFISWLLSLAMYILPALYLTPAKVRWWLVLLIVLLSLFGFI